MWAAGFGVYNDEPDSNDGDDIFTGRRPDTLQHANLYTVDEFSCAESWENYFEERDENVFFNVDERMICATSPNLKTICWGDSGGPLYDRFNEALVGLSVGVSPRVEGVPHPTCTTELPNLFTRVSKYVSITFKQCQHFYHNI